MAKRRKSLTRLSLIVASTAAALLLVEGAVRLRQYLRYGSTSVDVVQLERHPEHEVWVPVSDTTVGAIRVNNRGLRGDEVEVPKPAERLRVVFLGGSTTFCAEVSSDLATWPALVTSALAERLAPRQVDHANAGVPGWTSLESGASLPWRIAPLEPDVIVVYHGTNDLARHSRRLAQRRGLYDPKEHDEDQTWLGGVSVTWRLIEKNLRHRRMVDGAARPLLDEGPEAFCEPFKADLEVLVRGCQDLAPFVCLVTFSHRGRLGQEAGALRENCRSSIFNMPFMAPEQIAAAFDAYNDVIREVAAETGALLVEGHDSIPPDADHFNDSIHFRDPGAELQARRVVDVLLPALLADREER